MEETIDLLIEIKKLQTELERLKRILERRMTEEDWEIAKIRAAEQRIKIKFHEDFKLFMMGITSNA